MKVIEMELVETLIIQLTARKSVIHLRPEDLRYLQKEEDIRLMEYISSERSGKNRMDDVISQFLEDPEVDTKDYTSCICIIETSEKGALMMSEMEAFQKLPYSFKAEVKLQWAYNINPGIADNKCKLIIIISR